VESDPDLEFDPVLESEPDLEFDPEPDLEFDPEPDLELELSLDPEHPDARFSSSDPEHDLVLLSFGFFFIFAANNEASNSPSS
jgi:hypothetical protein